MWATSYDRHMSEQNRRLVLAQRPTGLVDDGTTRLDTEQLPELKDVATDQQTGGLATSLMIDRVTASRLGIAPTTIDNTLYDAFGQRQINTMYTQLNQYHVILETDPHFQRDVEVPRPPVAVRYGRRG